MTPAEILRKLADQIEQNESESFGGALVAIPPEGDAKHQIYLVAKPKPEFFWAQSAALMNIWINEVENDGKQQYPFGR